MTHHTPSTTHEDSEMEADPDDGDTVDSMHPAECALRLLLVVVNSEAQVHDETGIQVNWFIRGKRVTHIVTDCDGDIIGRGTSEIEAITDTIETRLRWEFSQREAAEAKIRAFDLALRGLIG